MLLFALILGITCSACFVYALHDLWVSHVTDLDNHSHDHLKHKEQLPVVIFYTSGEKDCAEQNKVYEEVAHQLPWVRFLRADISRHSVFKYQLQRKPPEFKVHLNVHADHAEHQEHGMSSFHQDVRIIGPILDEDKLEDAIKEAIAELKQHWTEWHTQVKQNMAEHARASRNATQPRG